MRRIFGTVLCLTLLSLPGAISAQEEAENTSESEASPPPPPPPSPPLLITTNVEGASIVVDDQSAIRAPARVLRLPIGAHRVRVEAEGYVASEQTLTLGPEGARLDVFLEATPAMATRLNESNAPVTSGDATPVHKRWWFWAAVGGGVVVLAGVIAAIAIAGGGEDGQGVIAVPPIPTVGP